MDAAIIDLLKGKCLSANTIAKKLGVSRRNVSRVCHRNPDIVRGDPASVGSYKDASNFRAWRLA